MQRNEDILISLQNLEVYYRSGGGLFSAAKTVKAVDGVSLDIKKGETLGLVGESGCGKSTTLRLIGGFERPDGGQVLIDGVDMAGTPPERRFVFRK